MSSAGPCLIDASAWIEVLRGTAADSLNRRVTSALQDGTAGLSEPVWLELGRGIKGKKEAERLESLRQLCVWLPFDETCWENAFAVARACTRAGVNVPLGDILVFACARTHSVELIEHDRHFAMIDRAARRPA